MMQGQAPVHITAPPERVWANLSDGTDATESFESGYTPGIMKSFLPDAKRQEQLQQGVETTWRRIKAAAEVNT